MLVMRQPILSSSSLCSPEAVVDIILSLSASLPRDFLWQQRYLLIWRLVQPGSVGEVTTPGAALNQWETAVSG